MKFIVIFMCLFLVTSCSEESATSNTLVVKYANNGIGFNVPTGWQVTEDSIDNDARYLFVESAESAIVTINVFQKKFAPTFEDYVSSVTGTDKEFWSGLGSIEKGLVNEIEIALNGVKLIGYRHEFNVKALGLNVPHVADYVYFETSEKIAYISCQVAQEDLDKVKKDFNMILLNFIIE